MFGYNVYMSEKQPEQKGESQVSLYWVRRDVTRFLKSKIDQRSLEQMSDEALLTLLEECPVEEDELLAEKDELVSKLSQGLLEKRKGRQLKEIAGREAVFTGDPYRVLGVRRETSFGDIRKAYHKLVRILHDDTFDLHSREHIDTVLLRRPEVVTETLKLNPADQESVEQFLNSDTLYPWSIITKRAPLSSEDLSRFALGQMPITEDGEANSLWISADKLLEVRYWQHSKPEEDKIESPNTEEDADESEQKPHETKQSLFQYFLTTDPLQELTLGDKTEEVREALSTVLADEACVNRIKQIRDDTDLRKVLNEKVKHEAHTQLLQVRHAWDKIKADQETTGINRSLEGFLWEDEEEVLGFNDYSRGLSVEALKRVDALVAWGSDLLHEHKKKFATDDEWEAELQRILGDDDSFHLFVPETVDPSEYGVRRFPYKEITLENGGSIHLRMPFYQNSGNQVVYNKEKPEPSINFDHGESEHWESYGEHLSRKSIGVKHLVVQAYKQEGRELPPGFFRDVADEFLLRDEQLVDLAQQVSEGTDVDDVIRSLGLPVPLYVDLGNEKRLLNEEDFGHSNRSIKDQIEEYEKLKKALVVYYEDRLEYEGEEGGRGGGIKLRIEPEGRWRLEFPRYEKSDSGEPEFDTYTLSADEVKLLLQMVGGLALT